MSESNTESAEATQPNASKEQEPTYEAIVERLEAIAKKLETGEPKLEEALSLFEEGVRLAKNGTHRLDEAERRLEVLLQNDELGSLEPGGHE